MHSYLHFIHPADDVEHLLEDPLQGKVHIQASFSSLEKLLQVVPQPQDVVFSHVNPFGVVVTLRLQLQRDVHQRLNTLLVCGDVCLDGIMLLLSGFYSRQVITKVILRREKVELYVTVN